MNTQPDIFGYEEETRLLCSGCEKPFYYDQLIDGYYCIPCDLANKALAKAKSLWGDRAWVQEHPYTDWPFWVGVCFPQGSHSIPFWPYGCGKTWNEAFDNANKLEAIIRGVK